MGDRRVVVFIQENKSTDFYFPTLKRWGAEIELRGKLLAAPPDHDQDHSRNAWVHYKMGDYPAERSQIDNDAILPFYSWLAKTFTFSDHHFGVGTNSTAGHMMLIGGQTPTMRNAKTVWDLPTIFTHAERHGVSWNAFPDRDKYPTHLYKELQSSPRVLTSDDFLTLAAKGTLPRLSYVWSNPGLDEHPPKTSNPTYVKDGHDLMWRRITAAVQAGLWMDTIFILTWDDWGGYADHVATPNSETVPDQLHPKGFQAIGGSRIPLIMFGGQVRQGIDAEWHSQATVMKTVMDLLGLPKFGVPRVDSAPSLAGRVDTTLTRPTPPAYGTKFAQPTPPAHPTVTSPGPWKGPLGKPMPPLVANGGKTIPAPTDGAVTRMPPSLPTPAKPYLGVRQEHGPDVGQAMRPAPARSRTARRSPSQTAR